MSSSRNARVPALLASALLAAAASGQTEETPPPADDRPDTRLDPVLTDRSLDEIISQRTTRPEASAPLPPSTSPVTRQVVPHQLSGAGALEFQSGAIVWASATTLLPEGTFLARRVGEIVRLRTGGLAFLPAAMAEGDAPPAIALLPCESYGRLEALVAARGDGLWVALTGEVFQYHGRNFVLPASFASVAAPDVPEDPGPDEPRENDAADSGGDPRIDELVRELEAQRSERRGIDTTFPAEPADGEGARPSIEGRMLLSQRARMVRTSQGGWAVAIDNDADLAPEGLPRQLRLLPSGLVEQMERQAERSGDRWSFEISGNLHRFGSAVYLVPRMYVSMPPDEVRAMQ